MFKYLARVRRKPKATRVFLKHTDLAIVAILTSEALHKNSMDVVVSDRQRSDFLNFAN